MEYGGKWCSGDLAPLSHLALALIGESRVTFRGRECASSKALKESGLTPLKLQAKEGLALINGTQVSSALAVEGLLRMENLLKTADLIAAVSVEATLSSRNVFKPAVHRLKKHPGQIDAAANVWNTLRKSEIVKSHEGCERVQDPYSSRCIPQVHGACRETWKSVKRIVENEINSVSDNPLVISESIGILNSGHFHAEAVGQASDTLAIAAAEIGGISERRVYRMMKGDDVSAPPFLAGNPGLESGYMIEKILAIELLAALHLLDLRRPLQPAPVTKVMRDEVRRVIPFKKSDRTLAPEIERAVELIRSRKLLSSVNSTIRLR